MSSPVQPSLIDNLLRWKWVLIAGLLGFLVGWAASTVLPLSMILHGGRYFQVHQAAESPPHAWFGHLRNAWTGQKTAIIVDFGERLDLAEDDRVQATFVATDETGVWNQGPRRIYKVEGSYSLLPPD